MGRHRNGVVSPQGRGRHRKPTNTGRNVARVATAGVVLTGPMLALGAGTANAAGFDRDAVIACESGGDARAQNSSSTASGLYQFINSTWRAYGGSTARAKDASVSEQHRIAARAFAAEGYRPWNASKSCWGSKIGAGTSVTIKGDTVKKVEKRVAPQKTAPKVSAPKVSAPKKVAPKQVAKSPKVSKSSANFHTVRSGDTLSGIAIRYTGNGTWSDLYAENRSVIGSDPHMIIPGQVLDVMVGK